MSTEDQDPIIAERITPRGTRIAISAKGVIFDDKNGPLERVGYVACAMSDAFRGGNDYRVSHYCRPLTRADERFATRREAIAHAIVELELSPVASGPDIANADVWIADAARQLFALARELNHAPLADLATTLQDVAIRGTVAPRTCPLTPLQLAVRAVGQSRTLQASDERGEPRGFAVALVATVAADTASDVDDEMLCDALIAVPEVREVHGLGVVDLDAGPRGGETL